MDKEIMYYWRELNKRYSSNQVFIILCYWILSIYQQIARGMSNPNKIMEWRSILLETLKESMNYDVKESAVRLSDRIEWTVLETDKVTIDLLMRFAQQTSEFFIGRYHLNRSGNTKNDIIIKKLQVMVDSLLRIAELNGLYAITPDSIKEVVNGIVDKTDADNMLDLCCGNGGLGIGVWQQLKKKVVYYGVDIEPVMCDVCRIMTYMCGISKSIILWQDILRSSKEETNQKYDLVLLDVPRGKNRYIQVYEYVTWLEGIEQKNIYVDWLYVIRAINVLSNNGKAIVVVTSGALTRKNEEGLRKKLIINDWVEAVITLPVNLYPNTRTGSEIIIFNKSKEEKREKKVLFIDISKFYCRDNRNFYSITQEGIDLVTSIFHEYYEMESIARILEISQLEEADWSLKPLRYMDIYGEKDKRGDMICLKDIARITRGVQLKKEEEDLLCARGTAFYINIKDIREGQIQYENAKKISPKSREWHEKFQIQENDILITSKGTSLKIAIVGASSPEAYICGNITLLRVNSDKYHPYVLFEYLTSHEGLSALESIQSGTTIRVLSNSNLENFQVPMYNRELMFKVGEQLKEKRKQYEIKQKELEENYKMKKNILLELIGIKNNFSES